MKGLHIMQAGSYKVKGTGSNGYAVKSASPDVPVMPIGISQISSEKCGKNNHDLYSCSIKSTQALVHNGSSILNGESTAAVKLSVSPNPAINLSLFNFCYDYFADVYFDKPGVKEKLISSTISDNFTAGANNKVFNSATLNNGVYFFRMACITQVKVISSLSIIK